MTEYLSPLNPCLFNRIYQMLWTLLRSQTSWAYTRSVTATGTSRPPVPPAVTASTRALIGWPINSRTRNKKSLGGPAATTRTSNFLLEMGITGFLLDKCKVNWGFQIPTSFDVYLNHVLHSHKCTQTKQWQQTFAFMCPHLILGAVYCLLYVVYCIQSCLTLLQRVRVDLSCCMFSDLSTNHTKMSVLVKLL